ncbi:hypothetical protein J6590_027044 [Homalodisca vitripennis]|nr:hypothetical protein J6590_027044 [Homalodisca vitripennis]
MTRSTNHLFVCLEYITDIGCGSRSSDIRDIMKGSDTHWKLDGSQSVNHAVSSACNTVSTWANLSRAGHNRGAGAAAGLFLRHVLACPSPLLTTETFLAAFHPPTAKLVQPQPPLGPVH